MPVHGVGLARLEFIVSRIGVHPQVCAAGRRRRRFLPSRHHRCILARIRLFIHARSCARPVQACLEYEHMAEEDPLKARIRAATLGAASPAEYYVHKIAEGVATIAAAFYPQPVIVRMSDFKTNEVRRAMGRRHAFCVGCAGIVRDVGR
jgi:phosphoenolpyruvate synthase/pyruvate phosphate dikinase